MGREPGKSLLPGRFLWTQSSCNSSHIYAPQETLAGQLDSGKELLAATALQANKS